MSAELAENAQPNASAGSAVCALIVSFSFYPQFDSSYPKPIAAGDLCPLHALAVDKRAVRARQVLNLEFLVAGGQAAMQARDKRAVDNEIGARGPAYGLDGA
jgi:hypothetical protein